MQSITVEKRLLLINQNAHALSDPLLRHVLGNDTLKHQSRHDGVFPGSAQVPVILHERNIHSLCLPGRQDREEEENQAITLKLAPVHKESVFSETPTLSALGDLSIN